MKPFFLLLLLIASGLLVAILSRPIDLLTESADRLSHWPARLQAKRVKAAATLKAARQPLSNDGWRPAAQF